MNQFIRWIATGFGAGYSPLAPGTMGSLLAAVIIGIVYFLDFKIETFNPSYNLLLVLLILIFSILGTYSANKLEKDWGHDSQKIVVDEMVGFWISIVFIPISWLNILLGLVFFRIFDIAKPWPVKYGERLPKGWGVMADDVIAGIMANVLLQLIYLYWKS